MPTVRSRAGFSLQALLLPALLPALLFAGACDDATGPAAPEQVVFEVDGTAFDIDDVTGVATVAYTVDNPSADTVYVNACGDSPAPWADRLEGGRWNRFSVTECPGPFADRPVPPGRTVSGTYAIDEIGEYRLGLAIRAEPAGDETWAHISDSFEVR